MPSSGGARSNTARTVTHAQSSSAIAPAPQGGPTASLGSAQPTTRTVSALAHYATFEAVVDLVRSQRDVKLLVEVESCIRLVSYQPGRIEFTPTPDAPNDLSQRLGSALQRWTGARWAIILSNSVIEVESAFLEIGAIEFYRNWEIVSQCLSRFRYD